MVMRRCRPPRLYCTMKVREPPSRTRSPKPDTSSSKKIASLLPAGSVRRVTLAWVSFMFAPLSSLPRCAPNDSGSAGKSMGRLLVHIPADGRQKIHRKLCPFQGDFLNSPPLLHTDANGYPLSTVQEIEAKSK